MKNELNEALVRDFPLTFYRDPQGCEPWSMFGFEVGEGWEPSIRKTAEKLELLIASAAKKNPEAYKFGYFRTSQLKEKFGTGRWYLSAGTDEMHDLVQAWEAETENICEQCGNGGKIRGRGWYYTSCFKHSKEEDRDSLEIVEEASMHKENNDKE